MSDEADRMITRAEASDIALAAAKEAVREVLTETFAILGVNLANFNDLQELRKTLEHAARSRKRAERGYDRLVSTVIGIFAGAVLLALWVGFRQLVVTP